jgi:hypothetical protein
MTDKEIEIKQAAKKLWELCNSSCKEEVLHQFLKENFYLFHNSLEMNHPRGVYSKVSLGPTYVTDFITYFDKTPGRYWILIEIELPNVPLFTKSGDPSRYLTHAIRQVTDWQAWISDNLAYARTFLTEILDPIGVVVIGRRDSLTDENKRQLRQILRNNRQLEIMTYDRLIHNSLLSADINGWHGISVHDAKHLMQNPPPPPREPRYRESEHESIPSVAGLTRFGFSSGVDKDGGLRILNPNNEFNDSIEETITPIEIISDESEHDA